MNIDKKFKVKKVIFINKSYFLLILFYKVYRL